MEQRISYIFYIVEGTSKKVLQYLMSLELIYNKNFCFNKFQQTKMFVMNNATRFKQ